MVTYFYIEKKLSIEILCVWKFTINHFPCHWFDSIFYLIVKYFD
jgi:hypothetical protein